MSEIDTKTGNRGTENLETHVAVAHESFKNLDTSINRLEGLIEKMLLKQKKASELKKIIIWASSTLFTTMLLALLICIRRLKLMQLSKYTMMYLKRNLFMLVRANKLCVNIVVVAED